MILVLNTLDASMPSIYLALQQNYVVTTGWEGKKFVGIDIQRDYTKRTCRLHG
jgi:hypothetical protein